MSERGALLGLVSNLARYHREHEKFYSAAPLEEALFLQQTSRTLKALAERWRVVEPSPGPGAARFAGAPDLNDPRAVETSGVLFMEGEGEPAEIAAIKGELAQRADSHRKAGEWLANAMESAWGMAQALNGFPELADVLGERHRIIANDWRAATLGQLVARQLRRACAILEQVDFTPEALREDLAGGRTAPAYVFSASELLDQAADLLVESAVLVHDNERRWRVFRERVDQVSQQEEQPV
jgi:hypothetical protein